MDETLRRALDSLARYLANRDHSEHELRTKLARRYQPEIIDQAIAFAHDHQLILAPELLAEKATREFGRRKKSHRYIQGQLRRRGLPSTGRDSHDEIEKIRQLLHGKFGNSLDLSYEGKAKAYRFLKYRGFEDSLIRKVLNEKLEE